MKAKKEISANYNAFLRPEKKDNKRAIMLRDNFKSKDHKENLFPNQNIQRIKPKESKLFLMPKQTDNELINFEKINNNINSQNNKMIKSEDFSSKKIINILPYNNSEEDLMKEKNDKMDISHKYKLLEKELNDKNILIEELRNENKKLKEKENKELIEEKRKSNIYEKILNDKENEIHSLRLKFKNLEDKNNKMKINNIKENNKVNQIINESEKEAKNSMIKDLQDKKINNEKPPFNQLDEPLNSKDDKEQSNFRLKSLEDKFEEECKIKKEEIDKRMKEIDKRKEESDKRMKEIDKRKEEIDKRKEQIDKRMEEIIERENEFNKRILFYEEKELFLEQEDERIKKLKEEFDKIKEENNSLKQKLDQLQYKNKTTKENPLKLYKKPTLIGLENIGAICFINASLQCLSQTELLSEYFLNNKNKEKIINNNIALEEKNSKQLSPCYLELIQNLWNPNNMNKSYNPKKFIQTVNDMNTLFKKGEAGDSKDFIIFILEQIHKELKKELKINKNDSNGKENQLNQYDKDNAFNNFLNEFTKEGSIISDIFFGFFETTNECQSCKFNFSIRKIKNPICYNYQIFNCLIFPLEEVKNMKNNYTGGNYNIVTLNDCFCYYTKSTLFNGQNQNYCNICKHLSDSLYTTRIYSGPNILIIILNRGKNNIYDIKLDLDEAIDLSQFIIRKDMPLIIYSLYGVITHIGKSGPDAHFVASCKSSFDNKWYRYNDSLVYNIKDIKKEIFDFGTPYILFYQKNIIK